MIFYKKTPVETLIDLINEGNPTLPFEINTTDYDFMEPVAIEPTEEGHDTEIRIVALPSAPYIGNTVLTYRRLNLANLFQGTTPVIHKWVENGGSSGSTTERARLYDFLSLYTNKYGITLEESEIQDVSLRERDGIDPARRFNITAKSTSLIYTGTTQAQWVIGVRELSDLLQIDEINDIQYPGGNDFSVPEGRKLYLTPILFENDVTFASQEEQYWDDYHAATMGTNSSNTSYVRFWNAVFSVFADAFEEKTGIRPTVSSTYGYRDTEFDFGGFVVRRISIPDSNYPETNSEYYNRVIVIECPNDCTWATGYIYLHYNV